MGFFAYIRQDTPANRGNTKGKIVALMFRLAGWASQGRIRRLLLLPYLAFYRLFVEWIMGIELPWGVQAGPGLRIFHGQATVINKATIIGRNCTIRQSTTIGNTREGGGCPIIGDNVEVGSNVCILGEITIGDHCSIGAGSVVVKSLPPNSVAIGNPARVIRTKEPIA